MRKTTILMIDIDRPWRENKDYLERVNHDLTHLYHLNAISSVAMISSTGRIHIAVEVSGKLSNELVVALQFALGSDPMRERMNLSRVRLISLGKVSPFWKKRWNVLYEKKLK